MAWFLSPRLTSGVLATARSFRSLSTVLQISSCPRFKVSLVSSALCSPGHQELVPADVPLSFYRSNLSVPRDINTSISSPWCKNTCLSFPKHLWGEAGEMLTEGPISHPQRTSKANEVARLQYRSWGGRQESPWGWLAS